MQKKEFFLYRLRHKKGRYDAFDTWFKSAKLAFAPMKGKFNTKHTRNNDCYNPELYEAVEYKITEIKSIDVNGNTLG
ncbi:MAG: hypothetical protein PHY47_00765 [Lachnospiraceae bacterium]|nr:hypothetical protein [Lachnospiraceae bacterium]